MSQKATSIATGSSVGIVEPAVFRYPDDFLLKCGRTLKGLCLILTKNTR